MKSRGQIRIVGGTWRSRRLYVSPKAQVRPTPIRLRQTLYDWIADWVVGRRVLDAFAGSGALGIEALSRGARDVVFIDSDIEVARTLERNLFDLGAKGYEVIQGDALTYLSKGLLGFDLILLDPPFSSDLISQSLDLLLSKNVLAADHRVYIEVAKGGFVLPEQSRWHIIRRKSAGAVEGLLLQTG